MSSKPSVSDLHTESQATYVFPVILWRTWRGLITIYMGAEGTAGLNHNWSGACWTPGSESGVHNCLGAVGINGCVSNLHIASYPACT